MEPSSARRENDDEGAVATADNEAPNRSAGDAVTTALVTGCAGFIGSTIAEACLRRGDSVVGVDSFTDYYDIVQKRSNIRNLLAVDGFEFIDRDLSEGCGDLVARVDVIYHQAGQPGVRASWRDRFGDYLSRNVHVTQLVLEEAVRAGTPKVVYASSSSVYGNADRYPVDETMRPRPHSPYGVTKLAGEHLCSLYAANFGLPVASLRYFTVYGPRQRPDMAIHRLFEAALTGAPFSLFGTGEQRRDFTFIDDVVSANLLAAAADVSPGLVANIAGGGDCSMLELISMVEAITERRVQIDRRDPERGDVGRTGARTQVAATELGWAPKVGLREGLERQHEWHLARR